MLFQAGTSERGREFAARNAEAIFIIARTPDGGAADDRRHPRAAPPRVGRDPEDIVFFQGMSFIVGGTEEEAQAKAAELRRGRQSPRGYAAHMGGGMGVDLADIDLDAPIGEIEQYNTQGIVKGLIDTAPDKTWTFGDLLANRSMNRIVGTPEQIADKLEEWVDAGVGGINMPYYVTPGSFADFIDGAGAGAAAARPDAERVHRGDAAREARRAAPPRRGSPSTHPGGRIRRERLGTPAAA